MRKNPIRFTADEKRRRKREAGLAAAATLTLFVGGASSQPGAGCDGQADVSDDAPISAPSADPGSDESKWCGGSFGPGTKKNPPTCGDG